MSANASSRDLERNAWVVVELWKALSLLYTTAVIGAIIILNVIIIQCLYTSKIGRMNERIAVKGKDAGIQTGSVHKGVKNRKKRRETLLGFGEFSFIPIHPIHSVFFFCRDFSFTLSLVQTKRKITFLQMSSLSLRYALIRHCCSPRQYYGRCI